MAIDRKGNEFVIQSYQGTSWQLSHYIHKISNAAGVGTIVRPFDNMRMSRSNEVFRRWGAQKESIWIGHSVKVMETHYLNLMDEDYTQAAGEGS